MRATSVGCHQQMSTNYQRAHSLQEEAGQRRPPLVGHLSGALVTWTLETVAGNLQHPTVAVPSRDNQLLLGPLRCTPAQRVLQVARCWG